MKLLALLLVACVCACAASGFECGWREHDLIDLTPVPRGHCVRALVLRGDAALFDHPVDPCTASERHSTCVVAKSDDIHVYASVLPDVKFEIIWAATCDDLQCPAP